MNRKIMTMLLFGLSIMLYLYPGMALASGDGGGRGGRPQGPPQEAFTACEGKSEGDTASFEGRNGETITGTCKKDRQGEKLLLVPDNMPERGSGGGGGRPDEDN